MNVVVAVAHVRACWQHTCWLLGACVDVRWRLAASDQVEKWDRLLTRGPAGKACTVLLVQGGGIVMWGGVAQLTACRVFLDFV